MYISSKAQLTSYCITFLSIRVYKIKKVKFMECSCLEESYYSVS